jgi:rod shape-determining protein MreB
MLRDSLSRLSPAVGVDLGTANTLVYVHGRGIVVREPSVIARTDDGQILAVGETAKQMIGRTPAGITASRPLRGGVIADFETTAAMLAYFLKKAVPYRSLLGPAVVVGIPSAATTVERRALIEAAMRAGARRARLIDEPLAAALGVGLPVSEPVASMIVDIGGGRTQVAVITLGGIVTSRSIRMAGDDMDDAIIAHARRTYNLLIGERTAEAVKIAIGSAYASTGAEPTMVIRGRDLVSGLPRTLRIVAGEIRDALAEPLQAILAAVRQTLEDTPPELAADLVGRGLVLVGGGSLLPGIDRLLTEATGMRVRRGDDPLSAVAQGTARALSAARRKGAPAS